LLIAVALLAPSGLTGLLLPTSAAAAPGITEFSQGISPGSQPKGIAAGPDGNLWFTEPGRDRIGRITPEGEVTEFSAGITPGSSPRGIAAGPDGNLWFTQPGKDRIGRITPEGKVTEFSAGITPRSQLANIAAGPDGNLWFTESIGDRIGRITPEGEVTEFSEGITAGGYPDGIAAGPDGNLWFTEFIGDRIGRITPEGKVTEFSEGITATSQPKGIAAGPDGNLWFTEARGDRVARITPEGVITEFSPGISAGAYPAGITAGPDGNLWFTETRRDRVGRITPSGQVTEFSAGITAGGAPHGIAAGSDGNLWFTQPSGDRVGRIADLPPVAVTGLATRISPSSATVTGTVNARTVPTKVHFQYGVTAAYGSTTAIQSVGAAATPLEISATLGDLAAGTVYHYRLVASNASGTSYGPDATFATLPTPPPDATAVPETGDSRARYRRALAAQARRKRGLRSCYATVGRHAAREQRQINLRGSSAPRARARRHLNRHRDRGRRACRRRHGRKPGRVTQLRARAVSKTKVLLSFRAPGTAGRRPPPAREYVVKQSRRPIRDRRGFRRAQTLCRGRCSFDVKLVGATVELTVTDLRPGTTYHYSVAARDNVSGRPGHRSLTVKARTRR
jgi:streptogramin lyase